MPAPSSNGTTAPTNGASYSYEPLPEPASPDAFVSIAPFETCQFTIPASLAILGVRGNINCTSWRFLIQHKPSNTALWFDLGVAHDLSLYPPRIQRVQIPHFKTIAAKTSPAEDAQECGVDPNDVKYIVASHAHWDHIFPAAKFHPNASVICGSGTLDWANPAWPTEPDSTFDGRIWDSKISDLPISEIPSPKTSPEKYKPLGPFKQAYDFFGDGSFWLIDAPGHCEGNLAGLVRIKTKTGRTKWAFLGGDCFHCVLFAHYPEAPFGKGVKVTSTDTYHEDEEGARDFIRRTAEFKKREGQDGLIWIAHTDTLEGVWEI